MATAHLPSYAEPFDSFSRTPSYSAEPGSMNSLSQILKHGDVKLRLAAQEDKLDLPVYGAGSVVEGIVELTKIDSISSVEIKVEGHLQLKENSEGGHTHHTLCLDTVSLWDKDANDTVCPSSLPFSLTLPTEFPYGDRKYPLPPSHSTKLEGLPGFNATIDYSVSPIINKPRFVPSSIAKSKTLGKHIGNTTVSTPFNYYPRTRPPVPLPSPLLPAGGGRFIERPEWMTYTSIIKMNEKAGVQDIDVKFYLPASRIFCASEGIPFHITFESDAHSLAAFLPYGPTTDTSKKLPPTRIQLMRQSTVDVEHGNTREGVSTAIWRVDYLGGATFRHAGDGVTCTSFSGEINIEPTKVMGFTVPGLSVQDCILLTVTPPEGTKAPFVGIREVIPVRLTTDAWTEDGRGISVARRSGSGSPERKEVEQ
ncbi:hypothetical protein B0H13DRAFT_1980393 [Mycena leptocephala]|nr:hypothetical protein B0H13DRAFT_1980393 [Mycena leptocephala]